MPVTVKLSQPAFTVDNRVDLCRAATVADADRLTSPPLSRSPRGSFSQGAIDQIEAAAFSATVVGKHTFRYADGIISRHITALACRQNPVTAFRVRRTELFHS